LKAYLCKIFRIIPAHIAFTDYSSFIKQEKYKLLQSKFCLGHKTQKMSGGALHRHSSFGF
jgi:hypothetical protein